MKLIIGGAYQGKKAYAVEQMGISITDIADGADCSMEQLETAVCIDHYHLLIRRLMAMQQDPILFTEALLKQRKDRIIIMDEIGSGIIPIEREERRWREQVGKTGCYLARKAELVERIFCGIAERIKG